MATISTGQHKAKSAPLTCTLRELNRLQETRSPGIDKRADSVNAIRQSASYRSSSHGVRMQPQARPSGTNRLNRARTHTRPISNDDDQNSISIVGLCLPLHTNTNTHTHTRQIVSKTHLIRFECALFARRTLAGYSISRATGNRSDSHCSRLAESGF